MSVDTSPDGRDLRPYARLQADDLTVLITPRLTTMAEELHVVSGGLLGRRLRVRFDGPTGDACAI